MIKVSVIVPVYNVESYIEACAVSLFEQTLDEIEYIFIDDGSTDCSMEILEDVINRYPARKKQINIIRFEKNRGLHEATKVALSHVKGKYFIRCDSDDWVDTNAYSNMYEIAVNNDADYVECSYYIDYDNGNQSKVIIDTPSSVSAILTGERPSYLCNKLFKSSLIPSIRLYSESNMWEDLPITLQLMISCKNSFCVDNPLYHYRYRSTSISNHNTSEYIYEKWSGTVKNTMVAIKSVGDHYKEYKSELEFLQLRSMFYSYPLLNQIGFIKEFRHTYPGLQIRMLGNRIIPIKLKLGYLLRYLGIITNRCK